MGKAEVSIYNFETELYLEAILCDHCKWVRECKGEAKCDIYWVLEKEINKKG